MAASISCAFLRCRCCGMITIKYMMPNMSRAECKKLENPDDAPACKKRSYEIHVRDS